MNAGKAPPAVAGPIRRPANLGSGSPPAAPLRPATRAGNAHLAGDRFRLWTSPGAHERLGDASIVPIARARRALCHSVRGLAGSASAGDSACGPKSRTGPAFGEIQMREQSVRPSRFRCGMVLSLHAGDRRGRSGGRVAAVLWRSARLLIGGGLEGVEHREAGGGAETVSAACDRDLSYRG